MCACIGPGGSSRLSSPLPRLPLPHRSSAGLREVPAVCTSAPRDGAEPGRWLLNLGVADQEVCVSAGSVLSRFCVLGLRVVGSGSSFVPAGP